jgi:hypothetical protein
MTAKANRPLLLAALVAVLGGLIAVLAAVGAATWILVVLAAIVALLSVGIGTAIRGERQ